MDYLSFTKKNHFLYKVKTKIRKYFDSCFLKWLEDSGFFTAPASSGNRHGSYKGGLLAHSLIVADILEDMTINNKLEWKNKRSPFVVGLFHDLCKIDRYVEIKKSDGESEFIYSDEKTMSLTGHGEKSVMLLSPWIQLTKEEILCIRYHMGAFETKDWSAFGNAMRECPNVLWTHHADMISSQIIGT